MCDAQNQKERILKFCWIRSCDEMCDISLFENIVKEGCKAITCTNDLTLGVLDILVGHKSVDVETYATRNGITRQAGILLAPSKDVALLNLLTLLLE